jgi:hypothetical protein
MLIFRKKFKNSLIYFLPLLFVILFFLSIKPTQVLASSLYFLPSSGQYQIGDSFTVNLYVDSAKDNINAVSGAVSFSQDNLQIISLNHSNSFLDLWAQEPTFSNTTGVINFKGVALNRGFSGSGGKVISINFKVIQSGSANLVFTSSSFLANSSQEASFFSSTGKALFNIKESITDDRTVGLDDSSLHISSSTHPDQNKWYANNSPELSWNLPEGTLEVRAVVGESVNTKPTISYIPPISEKRTDKLSDGTYCFNLSTRDAIGWGDVSHYCFNIDTTPPKNFIINYSGNGVSFKTVDDLSGVSHYVVNVDGQDISENLADDVQESFFDTQFLDPGIHNISVTAVDNAGNIIVATKRIVVGGINAPVITYYTNDIQSGDDIKILGTTYPNSLVKIYLSNDGKVVYEGSTTSNKLGKFIFVISKSFKAGIYSLTAKVIDNQKIESHETPPLIIIVKFKLISQIIDLILQYLSMIILIILALGSVVFIGVYVWHRVLRLVSSIQQKSNEKENKTEKVFKKKSIVTLKNIKPRVTKIKLVRKKKILTPQKTKEKIVTTKNNKK